MSNVYARVGFSFQQIGGDCPAGFIEMASQRPDDDSVAASDGTWVPAPVPVPQSVSAAQGGIALIRAGLMDDVQAAVDAPDTPDEVKWAWAKATIWDRNSPAFNYIADKAGITDTQKDALFIDANQIVP